MLELNREFKVSQQDHPCLSKTHLLNAVEFKLVWPQHIGIQASQALVSHLECTDWICSADEKQTTSYPEKLNIELAREQKNL